jgi:uncharacterized protein (DUF1501 family)
MDMTQPINRRGFIQQAGALGAWTAAGGPLVFNLAPGTAQAADTLSGYRALVCVFLAGGNDAFNTVVRADSMPGLSRYKDARQTIRWNDADLADTTLKLNIGATNNFTGVPGLDLRLNKRLANMRSRFNAGGVALIGNIGPLVKPMTNAAYVPGSVDVPPKLFSHNDQQSVWQSGKAEGAVSGWGGEFIRRLAQNNTVNGAASTKFASIGVEATAVFSNGIDIKVSGETVKPLINVLGTSRLGVLRPGGGDANSQSWPTGNVDGFDEGRLTRDSVLGPIFAGSAGVTQKSVFLLGTYKHAIEQDYLAKLASANDAWKAASQALGDMGTAVVPDAPANNDLAAQLRTVLAFIRRHDTVPTAMNSSRQVFFVQLGGFDTHNGQTAGGKHDELMLQLDEALDYFYAQLQGSGHLSSVTTFTASEFGRKLNENGDGSDHGWGGHHLVFGGSVKGGVYGQFPDLGTWDGAKYTDPQLLSDGTMVPKVSVDVFAKQLGAWLGLDWVGVANNKTALGQMFPNLANQEALTAFI